MRIRPRLATVLAGTALTVALGGCFLPAPPPPPPAPAFDISASATAGGNGTFCTTNSDGSGFCNYTVTVVVENVGTGPSEGGLTFAFTDEFNTYVVPAGSCATTLAAGATCSTTAVAQGDLAAPLDLTVAVTDANGAVHSETFELGV